MEGARGLWPQMGPLEAHIRLRKGLILLAFRGVCPFTGLN